MNIEKLWDRLEPGTRQWLVNNPGCRILPRSVVAAIAKATGEELEQDRHGETVLLQRLRVHSHRLAASGRL
ncbi:hypothetical protein [Pseudarthrobacter oxydans]|uniref:hypothetical protein n=1 Tax=Pseudarthrobacter oxydans TaxID=1671 RepID=UPI0034483DAE